MSERLTVDPVSYAATLAQRNRYREQAERLTAERDALAAELERVKAAVIAGVHADVDSWDGDDVHGYDPGHAENCAICAALAAGEGTE